MRYVGGFVVALPKAKVEECKELSARRARRALQVE
jgi:uncharacterized protein YbaA (DUF1428 family)